jgi:hypothetical protein
MHNTIQVHAQYNNKSACTIQYKCMHNTIIRVHAQYNTAQYNQTDNTIQLHGQYSIINSTAQYKHVNDNFLQNTHTHIHNNFSHSHGSYRKEFSGSVYASVYYVCIYVCMYTCMHLSIYPSVCLCVCLSVHLFTSIHCPFMHTHTHTSSSPGRILAAGCRFLVHGSGRRLRSRRATVDQGTGQITLEPYGSRVPRRQNTLKVDKEIIFILHCADVWSMHACVHMSK